MPEKSDIDLDAMGRRLAAARALRGYTQKQVAEMIEVSQATYSDYEHGRVLMGLVKFVALTRNLDVNADWLLGLPSGDGKGPF